jgi:hypothetical protein
MVRPWSLPRATALFASRPAAPPRRAAADHAAGPRAALAEFAPGARQFQVDRSAAMLAQRRVVQAIAPVQRIDPEKETSHLESEAGKWRVAWPWHSDDRKRRDEVLKKILNEAFTLLNSGKVTLVNVNDEGSGMTPRGKALEDRTYKIKINDDNPWGGEKPEFDPSENRVRSTILHELIHVAADQTYRMNESENPQVRAYNMDDWSESESQDTAITDEIDRIDGLVDTDNAFGAAEKKYVKFRLNRARFWIQELDTVMSELVYYFDLQGVPASSPTSRAVTAFAEQRYQRRSRHEGPIATREREITEKVKTDLWNQALMASGSSEAVNYLK